jgi:hypothetical protein
MPRRSTGVTLLAIGTIMVAVLSQYVAITLLLTSAVDDAAGSWRAPLTLATGLVFLGLMPASYAVGFGLWMRKPWSWRGATLVYLTLLGAGLALSLLTMHVAVAVVSALVVAAAIASLRRPHVRSEICRHRVDGPSPAQPASGLEAAG